MAETKPQRWEAGLTDSLADGLERAAPAEKGVDADAIAAFLDEAARLGVELNSFMLWRDDAVVAEGWWWPYRADRPHLMHSATKGFLSAAVGLAIAEKRFGLADRVLSFFPDHGPIQPSANLAAMTVEDLLTQTSGHADGASGAQWRGIQTSWIPEFLKIPVPFQPGTTFTYSSATSFMLSAILSRTTGESALAYLRPRLLAPLGIRDLAWPVGPDGINPGGNGISARTSDLLKLAALHLRGGRWNGCQLLDADWVNAATTPKRGNPYGYHWWIGPAETFYAYGLFGQFAFVFPRHDAVLVTTGAAPMGEETLRSLVWHHFPRAFEHTLSARAPMRDAALARQAAGLRLLPPLEPPPLPPSPEWAGTFVAEPNDDGLAWVRLAFEPDRCVFTAMMDGVAHEVVIGLSAWIEGDTTMPGAVLHHGYEPARLRVVAGGSWLAPDRLRIMWQFVETAWRDTVDLSLAEPGLLSITRSVNVNTGPRLRPPLRARRQVQKI